MSLKQVIADLINGREEQATAAMHEVLVTKIQEIVAEASHPARAWSGKIKKIDQLLMWMYEKDILTKGEKAEKDKIFHAYYRYYNDGDQPRALQNKGISKHDPERTEAELEKYLEVFIKKVLAKYLPKIDRAEFRADTTIKALSTVITQAEDHDVHGLLTYWLKKVKLGDDEKIKECIDSLQKCYDELVKAANEAAPESSNTTMKYRRTKMKEAGKWNSSLEKMWNDCQHDMDDISSFLKNLKRSVERLKEADSEE